MAQKENIGQNFRVPPFVPIYPDRHFFLPLSSVPPLYPERLSKNIPAAFTDNLSFRQVQIENGQGGYPHLIITETDTGLQILVNNGPSTADTYTIDTPWEMLGGKPTVLGRGGWRGVIKDGGSFSKMLDVSRYGIPLHPAAQPVLRMPETVTSLELTNTEEVLAMSVADLNASLVPATYNTVLVIHNTDGDNSYILDFQGNLYLGEYALDMPAGQKVVMMDHIPNSAATILATDGTDYYLRFVRFSNDAQTETHLDGFTTVNNTEIVAGFSTMPTVIVVTGIVDGKMATKLFGVYSDSSLSELTLPVGVVGVTVNSSTTTQGVLNFIYEDGHVEAVTFTPSTSVKEKTDSQMSNPDIVIPPYQETEAGQPVQQTPDISMLPSLVDLKSSESYVWTSYGTVFSAILKPGQTIVGAACPTTFGVYYYSVVSETGFACVAQMSSGGYVLLQRQPGGDVTAMRINLPLAMRGATVAGQPTESQLTPPHSELQRNLVGDIALAAAFGIALAHHGSKSFALPAMKILQHIQNLTDKLIADAESIVSPILKTSIVPPTPSARPDHVHELFTGKLQ